MLRVEVTGVSAKMTENELLTAGRVGLTCGFTFDSAWDGLQKTAVFSAGGVTRDVIMTGSTVTVPHEVMATQGVSLRIGVCGALADGTVVIPTMWVMFGRILSGALPSGISPEEPTPDVSAQIRDMADRALAVLDYNIMTGILTDPSEEREEP